jgi:hypothetical protein
MFIALIPRETRAPAERHVSLVILVAINWTT